MADQPTVAKLEEKSRKIQREQNLQHFCNWWDVLPAEDQDMLGRLCKGLFHVEPANTA